jgi:hypothetical protein
VPSGARADYEVYAMVINLAREDIAAFQDKFHLGKVLGVLAKLETIEASPIALAPLADTNS